MSRWRAVWLVARREILERGRSRAFLVSLALTVAIILAAVATLAIIVGFISIPIAVLAGLMVLAGSDGASAGSRLSGAMAGVGGAVLVFAAALWLAHELRRPAPETAGELPARAATAMR